MPRRPLAPAILLVLALALPARAQVTPAVDPADVVYEWLARLESERLLTRPLLAQQPLSRGEIARLAAEARRALAERDAVALRHPPGSPEPGARRREDVEAVLAALEAEVAPGRTVRPIDRAAAGWSWLESRPREVPGAGPDIGRSAAIIDPIADNRQGRWGLARGHNATLQGWHSAQLGAHLALSGSAGVHAGAGRVSAAVRTLSLAAGARNVRLVAGRELLTWGPAMHGGLAVSRNAPPLDLVALSSDARFTLPWLLRYVGPVRAVLFASDLGRSQNFPHARLVGYDVRIAPADWLELGTSVLVHTGGSGAPPGTFAERVMDVVPLLDVIFLGDRDLQFSNKLAGADVRVRLPGAAGVELFAEGLLDDFDVRRLGSSLWEDNGIIAGVRAPRLTPDGRWSARAEWHHTGVRYYEHLAFTSGITRDRVLVGDALGPRAGAVYARVERAAGPWTRGALTLAAERRSGDTYRPELRNPGVDDTFRFVREVDRPEELRHRALASVRRRLGVPWREVAGVATVELEAGYERVQHEAFAADGARDNLLVRVMLTQRF